MLERLEHAGAPAPEARVPSMTLGTYLAEAGKALRVGLPKAWVDAIVLEAKRTRMGLSIELVEPTVDESNDGRGGHRDGRLRCMIWSRMAAEIEESIGLPLDATTLNGAHVRMLIKTSFHPRWHLEGEVMGLDPTLVQGLVERRLEAIRATLREQNLYGAQRLLMEPEDVTSVAVIHPDRSAGWADVHAELARWQERGILRVTSHAVPFEGAASALAIANTLTTIAAGERPDLVLIVRGGGAAAGLASLANLTLAQAICRCPIPIVTGIGHASDRTILDELAWRTADTPSKALGMVRTILRQRGMAATTDHRTILSAMERAITGTLQPLLASAHDALGEAADKITAVQAARLRDMAYAVERHVIAFRGTIDVTQAELDRVAGAVLAAAPAVPRSARGGLASLYAGIVKSSRGRLPRPEVLSTEARRSAGLAMAFVERQSLDLKAALAALESAMRRRLGEETSRLAATAKAARALDLDATLARGFVLPLDSDRRIIRSATMAKAADRLELLFADGSVACRPTIA